MTRRDYVIILVIDLVLASLLVDIFRLQTRVGRLEHRKPTVIVHIDPPVALSSPPASRDFARPDLSVHQPTSAQTGHQSDPAVRITTTAQPAGRGSPTAAQWARLRMCESSDNYAQRANPHYRGAYQIGFAEWSNKGGFYDPADAPAALQDQRALEMWQARGWSPWYSSSGCSGLR